DEPGPRGACLFISPRIEDLLGYSPQEWLDDPGLWERRVHPDDRDRVLPALRRHKVSGERFEAEYRLLHRDGGVVWVHDSSVLVRDEEGRPLFSQGFFLDVTDRKEAELATEASRSLLEATLDSTADGILVVDLEGRIVSHNARFAELWRIPHQVLTSGDDDRALASVLDQLAEPEAFLSKVREVYADPEAESFDVLEFRDGRVFERASKPQRLGGRVVGRVWSFRDVTERERAVRELRRAERDYRLLVERLPAIVYVAEPGAEGTWHYVSPQVKPLLGYAPEEWTDHPELWIGLVHPADRGQVLAAERRTVKTGAPFEAEYRLIARDGRVLWVRDEAILVPHEGGTPRLHGVMLDVTERRRAEEGLRASEARATAVVQTALDCVVVMDHDGRIVEFNPAAERTFGHRREDIVGRPVADLIPERLRQAHFDGLRRFRETGEDRILGRRIELQGLRADGTEFPVELSITHVDGADIFVGYLRDITERKRAEEEIRRNLDLLQRTDAHRRELLSRLVDAQEEERRRLAGEIHDDSVQIMSAVGVRLETLRRKLAGGPHTEAVEGLQRTVEEAIGRLRHLLFELRPPALDREGLIPALRMLVDRIEPQPGQRFGIHSDLAVEPAPEARLVLYRIAQEALTNARKHAGPGEVTLSLVERDRGALLRIRDQGHGFDPRASTMTPGHIGLSSMRERAEMAGGWLRVDSAPGRGTTVEAWVPLGDRGNGDGR
ncbi:MAG TPA: PAS domain S-box protein, partial [Actinomycetota bacterium]|nr:PAS domain S-box protein [Actinomycetota bacterium]